jgi:hypothetical protein
VDKAEDLGAGAALMQSTDYIRVGYYVGLELARLDIEDKDEDGHRTEDVAARLGKVVLDETVLTVRC